jgi:hypothetical protein
MREASDEVCEAAEVVHSLRMVVLCAMQALPRFVVSGAPSSSSSSS